MRVPGGVDALRRQRSRGDKGIHGNILGNRSFSHTPPEER
jgi:hypothetical protein